MKDHVPFNLSIAILEITGFGTEVTVELKLYSSVTLRFAGAFVW